MKIFLIMVLFTFATSNFAAAKWDKEGCSRIEAGVGSLIAASEAMRGLSEAAGRDDDSKAEKELRGEQLYYLESANHWSSIYSAFCK